MKQCEECGERVRVSGLCRECAQRHEEHEREIEDMRSDDEGRGTCHPFGYDDPRPWREPDERAT